MITLYYAPGKASLTPHMILNEIGCPFELVHIDSDANENRTEAYLRMNPNGRIPTLLDGDLVVYETSAILLHLVDRFPAAGLAPSFGSAERSIFYRWVEHLSNTIQPEMRTFFYPDQHVGVPAHVADVKETAEKRLGEMFALVDRQLGTGPYLLGERYSAADPYLMMLVRWGRNLKNPARNFGNLRAHAERVLARPRIKATIEHEGLTPPLI
jgi:glutathione S-transferase